MKTFRVLQIGEKFHVQRWTEIKRNLFFGLIKRKSHYKWENIPRGLYIARIGYLQMYKQTCFDNLDEAIDLCTQLINEMKKPITVFSI